MRPWWWISGLTFLLGLVLLWQVAGASEPTRDRTDSFTDLGQLLVAIAALAISAGTLVHAQRQARAARHPGTLESAASRLEKMVKEQWEKEIRSRRLRHPHPLRLRWEPAGEPVAAPGATALRRGGLVVDDDTRVPAESLVNAFRSLKSRQLVILGEPGAGKSTLAMLFTSAALAQVGPGEPVPVLLTLSSWRPREEPLQAWIARRIGEDYPELTTATEFGAEAAQRLVNSGLVLPVLDGLDEVPQPSIGEALTAIEDAAGLDGLPFVLTCRTSEYRQATESVGRLSTAAAVAIRPIQVEDSIRFLVGDGDNGRWSGVVARMRAEPEGLVATALSTPLMVALARAVYGPTASDPGELARLSSTTAIEDRLLSRFVPTAYLGKPEFGARAGRWLSLLAHHLEHRVHDPNLAWWQLAWAVPRAVIFGTVAFVMAVGGGVACVVARPFPEPMMTNLLLGLVLGLAAGVVAGLNAVRSLLPAPRWRSRVAKVRSVADAALRDGCAGAAVFLLAALIVADKFVIVGWDYVPFLMRTLVFGAAVGIALGLVTNGLRVWRGSVPNRASLRLRPLLPSLISGFGTGLLVGVPVGVVGGLIAGFRWWQLAVGVEAGLQIALAVGGAIGVPIGIGRWLSQPVGDQDPLSPRSVVRGDRITIVAIAASAGVSAGVGFAVLTELEPPLVTLIGYWPASPIEVGMWGGLVTFGVALLGSGSLWLPYTIARIWLAACGRLPWPFMRFLDDAHNRDILRQVGPVYQFRHARLQAHLAKHWLDARRPAVARWFLEGRTYPDASALHRALVPGRRGAMAATTIAAVVLSLVITAVGVPPLRQQIEALIAEQQSAVAHRLISYADKLADSDPEAAFQLRIAAAEIDPYPGSGTELALFLRMREQPGDVLAWYRSNAACLGDRATTVLHEGTVTVWDMTAVNPQVIDLRADVSSVTSSEDCTWLLLLQEGGLAQAWHVAGSRTGLVHTERGVEEAEFLDDGALALVRHRDGSAAIWDLAADPIRSAELGPGVFKVEVSGDDRWALVYDRDESAAVWDLATWPPRSVDLGSDVNYRSTLIRTEWIKVMHTDGTAVAWDLTAASPRRVELGAGVEGFWIAEAGRWAYGKRRDGTRVAWDLSAHPPQPVEYRTRDVTFLAAGRAWALVAHPDFSVTGWNPADPLRSAELASGVFDVEVSGDDRWALVYSRDESAAVWDLATWPPRSVNLGSDVNYGHTLIGTEWIKVMHTDGTAVAWDLTAASPRRVELGAGVERFWVDEAGRWAYGERRDGTTVVWDLSADSPVPWRLGSHVTEFQLSTNARWAVATHGGDLVTVWHPPLAESLLDSPMRDPVVAACATTRSPLTEQEWERYVHDVSYHQVCRN